MYFLPLLLILGTTCAFFGSTAAVPRTYVDDGLALLAFKAAIADDPLRALESWTETLFPDPCTWMHVGCNANFRVINITLPNLSLVGTISSALGSLDQLTYLDLSVNTLQVRRKPYYIVRVIFWINSDGNEVKAYVACST